MKRIAFKYRSVILTIFLCCACHIAFANPDPWGDGAEDAPIDGGLSLLIAGGMAYGVSKIRKHNRNKKE